MSSSMNLHLTLSKNIFSAFQPPDPATRMKSLLMMSSRWRMVWILQVSCGLCSGCQIAAGHADLFADSGEAKPPISAFPKVKKSDETCSVDKGLGEFRHFFKTTSADN